MSALQTVFFKEVRDNIRDRRTVLSALGMAILAPALFMGLMSFVLETTVSDVEKSISLPVVGMELAPNMMAFLRQNNIDPIAGPENPDAAVSNRDYGVVLVIPENFGESLKAGMPAPLRLVYDSSRTKDSERDYRRVRDVLRAYNSVLAGLRLQIRGISPTVVQPLAINVSNVASPSAQAISVLGVIPYFVIFSMFMGGFYLAIDTTAGEREQGSLEPLLAQPVARASLALGKLLATALFSAVTLLLVLLAFSFAIDLVPLEKVGMSVEFGLSKVLRLFATLWPLSLLAAAFMMVVASFTKSFKEAQTYLTVVILVPTLPLMLVAFLAPEATATTMAIPSFSQALIITEGIKGEWVSLPLTLLSMVTTLVVGAALAFLAVKLYQREGIL
ncbi:MAG: ABC transporter permease [Pseudomonadota bacterium]